MPAANGYDKLLLQADFSTGRRLHIKPLPPFLTGDTFPAVYLECPLLGAPFLDATVLYNAESGKLAVDAPAADGTRPMLDWFSKTATRYPDIACGFEQKRQSEMIASFAQGENAALMRLLESWGIIDGRWRAAVDASFTRVLPVERGGDVTDKRLNYNHGTGKTNGRTLVCPPEKGEAITARSAEALRPR